MNKNSKIIVWVIIVIVIIGAIVWFGHRSSGSNGQNAPINTSSSTTTQSASASVSQTTKVSGQLSQYQNAELGFSVKYPSGWEVDPTDTGVNFVMPIDKSQVSTIATLTASVMVTFGKCSFPPVTTVQDRETTTIAGKPADMILLSNNVQGREYNNRMYALQSGSICYFFSFASIALSPTSKNLTGSNVTQAQNNNKAITASADSAFSDMVKSFAFVTGPAGVDETKASPAK